MTFFLAISARSCAPFQFFTVQDLVRGECDVWYFTNMILLLFRFFLSPPSCGGAVGRVPSVGDLYPTDNSNYSVCASVDTLVVNCTFFIQHQFICVVRPFLWYFGFLCLVHSCIHQKDFFNACSSIVRYRQALDQHLPLDLVWALFLTWTLRLLA